MSEGYPWRVLKVPAAGLEVPATALDNSRSLFCSTRSTVRGSEGTAVSLEGIRSRASEYPQQVLGVLAVFFGGTPSESGGTGSGSRGGP